MYHEHIESRSFGEEGLQELRGRSKEIFERELISYAEHLLESKKNRIGIGSTAEVHVVDVNEKHCFKIISRREVYDTAKVPTGLVKSPKYHPLPVEAEFLVDAQDLHSNVRVPKPYYTVVREGVLEDDNRYGKNELSLLAMERLNAASITSILEGEASLPENFDPDAFFKKMREFLQRMHSIKKIHHRDLHGGNVMVDLATGLPYVIDFGSAAYGSEDDVYRDESPRREVTVYQKDSDSIDTLENKVKLFLTKNFDKNN